jgi:hypothetical protein
MDNKATIIKKLQESKENYSEAMLTARSSTTNFFLEGLT